LVWRQSALPNERIYLSDEHYARQSTCCVDSYRTFVRPEYRPGWFHQLVAKAADQFLVDVAEKRSPRLILTAPPQHRKSELISRRLPAFALGRNPHLKIIATSYSADRALDFSADVQRIMDSARYHEIFPNTRIVGQFAKAGEAKRSVGLFEVVVEVLDGDGGVGSGFTTRSVCSTSTASRIGHVRQRSPFHRSHNPGHEVCRSA
jgi:hypothetical protein